MSSLDKNAFLQTTLDRLRLLNFSKVANYVPPTAGQPIGKFDPGEQGRPIDSMCAITARAPCIADSIPPFNDRVNLPATLRWGLGADVFLKIKARIACPADKKNSIHPDNGRPEDKIPPRQSLAERYQLRTEDERSDRAKANVLAFERLYRRVFCLKHAGGNDKTVKQNGACDNMMNNHPEQSEVAVVEKRALQAALSHGFGHMSLVPTRREIEWAHDR